MTFDEWWQKELALCSGGGWDPSPEQQAVYVACLACWKEARQEGYNIGYGDGLRDRGIDL